MNLKKLISFLIISICIAAVVLPLFVFAQGPSTSNGTITFNSKSVTPPVDPEQPTEPQEPPEVPGTGQQGDLTLDVVPHPQFGEYPVPTINTTYNSKIVAGIGDKTGGPGAQTFIQVSDARSAYSGWNIQVKADVFINSIDPSNQIDGAKIIFSAGSVNGPSYSNMPTAYAVILNCTGDIDTQNEEKIFTADAGDGVGTWINRLYPVPWTNMAIGDDNPLIQLFIPAGSGARGDNTYVSNLTWTLSDAP